MNRKIKLAVASALLMVGCSTSASAADDTTNDKVLVGERNEYVEFFKQDHPSKDSSDKNYLYTRTEIDAPPPGKCVVVTGASETSVAVACNFQEREETP